MELRQLEYLVAVAEQGSFTKAAEMLHVAQPGVSAQIRQLERELGLDLIDRSGRRIRPTEAGGAVLPYARAALQAVGGAQLAINELTGLLRGHLAVGMVVACAFLELVDLLAGFHRDHPAVDITLIEADTEHLVDALRSGQLDVAVIGLPPRTPPGIEVHIITDEPIVIAVSNEDPWAARETVTLEALQDRSLISLPRGTGLRACLDAAFTMAGFQPRIAFEASNLHVLAQLARRGLGPAAVPESTARSYPGELHAVAVMSPEMRGRLALAWRAEGPVNPATRVLVSRVRAALAGPSPDRQKEARTGVALTPVE